MINSIRNILFLLMLILLLTGCSQSDTTIEGKEVLVATDGLDVKFVRVKPFSNSYLLFGGAALQHRDAFTKITLAGIELKTARYLYARFPDFHLCKSAGAPLAKREVRSLDIVPADGKILKILRKALAAHDKSLEGDGKRPCVMIKGDVLRFKSCVVRANGQNITGELPPQVHRDYYLVTEAKILDSEAALADG
jgi:hypothetical protein